LYVVKCAALPHAYKRAEILSTFPKLHSRNSILCPIAPQFAIDDATRLARSEYSGAPTLRSKGGVLDSQRHRRSTIEAMKTTKKLSEKSIIIASIVCAIAIIAVAYFFKRSSALYWIESAIFALSMIFVGLGSRRKVCAR
jgi:hypothetical protein